MDNQTADIRRQILAFFQAGVAAADPYLAVKKGFSFENNHLEIRLDLQDATKRRIGRWAQIHLIAFGKAACAMAEAAQEIIPAYRLAGKGIAVTPYDYVQAVENFDVIGAGHPLPDSGGLKAARIIAEHAQRAQQGDLVLVLVSGGGSALLPYPVPAISLEEKITTTNLLLSSGATINEINCVRKHLSQLKGGGLTKLAYPADLHAMILSDVLGDDLSAIASGPTVPDDSRFSDAIAILLSYQVWEQAPASVQSYLQQGAQHLQAETPKSGAAIFKNCSHTLVGGNAISLDAVLSSCEKSAYLIDLYSTHLCGEARTVAENLALYAKTIQTANLKQPTAIIAGGETTVTLSRDNNGMGGRNQEMVLAFALAAEQYCLTDNWTFLSGGTDGRDGPTDAAGGIADAQTLHRIRQAGLDPALLLNRHDAYTALKATSDLLMTGPTGTNVADLQILLLHPVN